MAVRAEIAPLCVRVESLRRAPRVLVWMDVAGRIRVLVRMRVLMAGAVVVRVVVAVLVPAVCVQRLSMTLVVPTS